MKAHRGINLAKVLFTVSTSKPRGIYKKPTMKGASEEAFGMLAVQSRLASYPFWKPRHTVLSSYLISSNYLIL